MFFLVWSGRGLLAVVAGFLPLLSCVVLSDFGIPISIFVCGLAAVPGGWLCWHFGRKWNRESSRHTFYYISLQTWGRIYLIIGVLLTFTGTIAVIRRGWFG